MDTHESDQQRHIRQALADLIFGLALFVLFVLLGVFGTSQVSSHVQKKDQGEPAAATPLPKDHPNGALRYLLLPSDTQT